MACTQILVHRHSGGPEWGMQGCFADGLNQKFGLFVAQTTLSKEWIDKVDKFPDKNFHVSVILRFAKNQAVMNTTASSW